MRARRRRRLSSPRWLWGMGTVLGLAVMVVCLLLITHNRAVPNSAELESSDSSRMVSEPAPATEPVVSTETTPKPELPKLAFLAGSLEEACGFNELPTYWVADSFPKKNRGYTTVLTYLTDEYEKGQMSVTKFEECQSVLDEHMSNANPYHFLFDAPNQATLLKFVVLDEPFTFERIFANPADDLTRMQDALSRPECMLEQGTVNWELDQTCHTDALLNFALVNVFCFGEGVDNRIRSVNRVTDTPTLKQDRQLWKQDLEDEWVEQKCEGLDPTLELTAENYPELYALILSLNESEDTGKAPLELLVELAARFGNEVAGLTEAVYRLGWNTWSFKSEGYKFGRMFGRDTNVVSHSEWMQFAPKWGPSTDRFQQTFYMLAKLSAWRLDPRDEIEFDWEFVARHLCEPPYEPIYERRTDSSGRE